GEHGRHKRRGHQPEQRRELLQRQQRRRVRADAVEGALPERHLPGEAHQQRHPDGHDGGQPEQDVDGQRAVVQHQGQGQRDGPGGHPRDDFDHTASSWIADRRLACTIITTSMSPSATSSWCAPYPYPAAIVSATPSSSAPSRATTGRVSAPNTAAANAFTISVTSVSNEIGRSGVISTPDRKSVV